MKYSCEKDFSVEDSRKLIKAVSHEFSGPDGDDFVAGLMFVLVGLVGGLAAAYLDKQFGFLAVTGMLVMTLVLCISRWRKDRRQWLEAGCSTEDLASIKEIIGFLSRPDVAIKVKEMLAKARITNRDLNAIAVVLDQAVKEEYENKVNQMARSI